MSGLVLGAVAYDPKVVTIWDGFRRWLRGPSGLDFDYVLYSNYERQVEDLVAGPHRRRLELAAGLGARPAARGGARRHADARSRCATPTATCARSSWCGPTRPSRSLADLRGRIVATGAVDSPQATLLPLSLLRRGRACEPGDGRRRPPLRHRRRAARRPHRRRAGRGPRAVRAPATGRRGLHDRLQPAAVRPRGRAAGRRGPGPRPDAAVRPLHDDRGAVAADADADSSASASCCSAWTTPTRTCARCSTWKGSRSGAAAPGGLRATGARGRRGRLLRRARPAGTSRSPCRQLSYRP